MSKRGERNTKTHENFSLKYAEMHYTPFKKRKTQKCIIKTN